MKLYRLSLVEGINPPRSILVKGLSHNFPDQTTEWYQQAITWMLQADPIAIKSSFGRTPYLKNILRWWTSLQCIMPEDIQTIRDTLTQCEQLRNHHGAFIQWLRDHGGSKLDIL